MHFKGVRSSQALRTGNRQGFTLIEIMLALTITALVISVVYTTMRSAGRSLQGLSVRNELYRSSYALLSEIGMELASAYISPNGPINGRAITYFYVEDKEEDEMPQDNLYFTTLGHAYSPLARGESDQSEICYKIKYSNQREELVVLKKQDLVLDDLTCKDESDNSYDHLPLEELPFPVATGIHPERGFGFKLVGFQVDCFRTGDIDEEPIEEWDSTREGNRLPSRVKVTLTYKDQNDNLLPFSKTILLRLQQIVS